MACKSWHNTRQPKPNSFFAACSCCSCSTLKPTPAKAAKAGSTLRANRHYPTHTHTQTDTHSPHIPIHTYNLHGHPRTGGALAAEQKGKVFVARRETFRQLIALYSLHCKHPHSDSRSHSPSVFASACAIRNLHPHSHRPASFACLGRV